MTNEEWRNHRYYKFDPFAGEIPPALLNSADIMRYVEEDCLIKKEDFNIKRLKTASYEMRFLGKLYDWTRTDDGRLKKELPGGILRRSCDPAQKFHNVSLDEGKTSAS